MEICICLDSEDYLTPQAADAELWWARELSSRGIRGNFQCVGEMVRTLERTGRQDVIDAIGGHEIGIHTDYHSAPPNHAELLEGKSLPLAVATAQRLEEPCFATLRRAFGRTPISYVSPGDSWTAATLLAMAQAGVKVWPSHRFDLPDNRPFWYCGLLALRYAIYFDTYYYADADRRADFMPDFMKVVEQTADDGVIVVATHPCRLVNADWADRIFFAGKAPPRASWGPAPQWSAARQQRNKDQVRRWLDELQSFRGARITDLGAVYERCRAGGRELPSLLREAGLSAGTAGDLPLREQADSHVAPQVIGQVRYRWPVYAPGFTGAALVQQARQLAWTSAPAGACAS
jgi:hypothetical protein